MIVGWWAVVKVKDEGLVLTGSNVEGIESEATWLKETWVSSEPDDWICETGTIELLEMKD